jgi:hypothetical protein
MFGYHKEKARQRRGFAIHAYCGPNGSGKSLAMVHDTLLSLEAGRPCLSTVRLTDPEGVCERCGERPCACVDGRARYPAHPLYVPLLDFRQILAFERGDVLMDEITGVASSREFQGLPVQVANWLVQLRRRDVLLRWSAPGWARADKIIRECSQGVTICKGMRPEEHIGADDRAWKDNRWSLWTTYDATEFDEWTEGKREKNKAKVKQLFVRPGTVVERSYNTFDSVTSLGAINDVGTCMDCGGRRSRHACKCAPSQMTLETLIEQTVDLSTADGHRGGSVVVPPSTRQRRSTAAPVVTVSAPPTRRGRVPKVNK